MTLLYEESFGVSRASSPGDLGWMSKLLNAIQQRAEERGELRVLCLQIRHRLGATSAMGFRLHLDSAPRAGLDRVARLLAQPLPKAELRERLLRLLAPRSLARKAKTKPRGNRPRPTLTRARASTTTPPGTRRKNGR